MKSLFLKNESFWTEKVLLLNLCAAYIRYAQGKDNKNIYANIELHILKFQVSIKASSHARTYKNYWRCICCKMPLEFKIEAVYYILMYLTNGLEIEALIKVLYRFIYWANLFII